MENRRSERHEVKVAGAWRQRNNYSRDVWIKDISESGCRFHDRFSILEVDKDILVRIGKIGPIPATVRWREGHIVGASFEKTLHPGVLDHIVKFMSEKGDDE
ncbi:PilZ domain-containing protein [Qipengyuania sp. 1XM1-15A]|uniref:PilZ domain-containing protein n=1 Tax=Qipengyuania xiamenensis TaxID=2867237 RepID=UPI001C8845AB|nr:PilZ domain-containing protein [Qipengyuania xiamenensis]MBX7533021.1 PilZ domain-containing protein [Qipengyuania xiamenensis]